MLMSLAAWSLQVQSFQVLIVEVDIALEEVAVRDVVRAALQVSSAEVCVLSS